MRQSHIRDHLTAGSKKSYRQLFEPIRINDIPFYSASTRKNNKEKSSLVNHTHQKIFTFLTLQEATDQLCSSSNKEKESRHGWRQQRRNKTSSGLAWQIAGQAAFNKSVFWLVWVTLSKGHLLFTSTGRSICKGQQKNPARVTNVLVTAASCSGNYRIFQECLLITKPKLVWNTLKFLIAWAHLICK